MYKLEIIMTVMVVLPIVAMKAQTKDNTLEGIAAHNRWQGENRGIAIRCLVSQRLGSRLWRAFVNNAYANEIIYVSVEIRRWLGHRHLHHSQDGWHIGLGVGGGYGDLEWKRHEEVFVDIEKFRQKYEVR